MNENDDQMCSECGQSEVEVTACSYEVCGSCFEALYEEDGALRREMALRSL